MRLMGLDPATSTGFAICGDNGHIHTTGKWSPSAKWTKQSNESADVINARVANECRRWMMTMIRQHSIDMVGFEDLNNTITNAKDGKQMFDPVSRNKQAAIQCGLRMGCEELSIPFFAFADSTWRKSFLGHGKKKGRKALKAEAKAMCELMQIEAKNEDAREAAGVLYHLQVYLRHPRHECKNAGPLFKEQAA